MEDSRELTACLTLAMAQTVGWVSCHETCHATTPKRGCLAACGRAAALLNLVPKTAQIYKAPQVAATHKEPVAPGSSVAVSSSCTAPGEAGGEAGYGALGCPR